MHGSRFTNTAQLACRFSDYSSGSAEIEHVTVVATFVSPGLVLCAAPEHPPGSVIVEVSVNGLDFSAAGLVFTYSPSVDVRSLTPAIGPDRGGTLVTVTGHPFIGSDSVSCKFGSVVVPAMLLDTVQGSHALQCVSPPRSTSERAVPLEVS